MHRAGINHRDFYLCHFHLDETSLPEPLPRCYLIDLHRAQIRGRTPRRWRVKDLAGLYFSAMDCGLGQRDLLRFMRHYSEGGLRTALGVERGFWQQVERRALMLYRKAGASRPQVDLARDPQHGQC
jgi:heptose I phosphotransferase